MIKLIATDMDGTFLDSNKSFDPRFLEVFYKLKDLGIKFVIASGNQYYRLYQIFLPMSKDMCFIAENGSYIANGTTELYCNTMTKDNVEKIKEVLFNTPRIFMVLCGRKGAYVLKDNYEYKDELKKYYCMFSFVDSFDDIDDDIMKISIYDPKHCNKELVEDVRKQLPNEVKIVTSGNEWMDIQNKTIHKGIGMKYLQTLYGINPSECAAFGDQMNDYELLQQVKYGYAMSNAVDPIKEIAFEVIGSNDEQAVITKIEQILEEASHERD